MKELLKNKNVWLLWISRALSRFGDAFETLALTYLVYDLTGSALAMGTIMIFSMVPNILISPIAGVIVDRYDKKKILFISEMARTLLILIIPMFMFMGILEFWHVCIISAAVSVAESFYEPGSGIVFKLIVRDDQLPLLNSLTTTTNSIMRMIGYALSTTVMLLVGKEIIFIADSITFLISALSALFLTIPKLETSKIEKVKDIYTDFINGLKYIRAEKFIIIILIAYFLIDAIGTPISNFMPILTEDFLKIDMVWAGYLLTITSVGSIIGSMLLPILMNTKLKLQQVFLITFFLLGIIIAIPCYIPGIVSAIILFFIVGVISPIVSSWGMTYIQIHCNTKYLGRVYSVINVAILASIPLAAAIVGWAVDIYSLKLVFKITALISIISSVVLKVLMKKNEISENVENKTVNS